MKAGISVYTSKETIEALGIKGHRITAVNAGVLFTLGGFLIIPFLVPHGGITNFGYLISHNETGKVVFITDAEYVPVKFKELSNILVESNYDDDNLVTTHGVGKHMSISTCMNFLKSNDLSKVHSIVLLHMSASNSNEKQFIKSVQEIAPNAKVIAADKGISINLSIHPF